MERSARSRRGNGRPRKTIRSRQDTVGPLPTDRIGRRTAAETIGRFIRATRESQNLSQERLAALTRGRSGTVSRAMISAVERGCHLPGLEVLLTLSQVLHISPNEILERLELSRVDALEFEGRSYAELDRLAGETFWSGDHRRAAACYEAMLVQIREEPPRDPVVETTRVATTEVRRGAALRRCGATAAARAAVEHAISMTDGAPEIQAQAYVVLAALHVQLGCLPLARDAADRAVELSESGGLHVQGWAWIEKGETLAASKKFAEARRAFLEAGRRVRAAGDRHHEINVEGNIGWCMQGLGDRRRARTRYVKAVELARRYKAPASEALWLVALGRVALLDNQPEEADTYAAAALAIAKPMDNLLTSFRAEWVRHLVQRQRRPEDPDRHRVAYLRKLYARLQQHRGVEEITEFERTYRSASAG